MTAAVGADPVTQVIVHPLRRSVCLPFVRPPVHGARGREVGRQRPPHRSVMGEVADGIDDVSHAPAGRAAAVPGQPRRGRQQRFAHRPFRLAHVRGVPAGTGTAREPARAAPARHSTGDSGWVDITDGGRVERHAGLLASRWLRHPSGYQGLLHSRQQHASLCRKHPGASPRQADSQASSQAQTLGCGSPAAYWCQFCRVGGPTSVQSAS